MTNVELVARKLAIVDDHLRRLRERSRYWRSTE